jgi:protein involved in polysaccharide export with SLBB domain
MPIKIPMKLTFLTVIVFLILMLPHHLFGQSFDKNMKADDVTDEQIALLKARLSADGMSIADFEAQAIAAGASPAEVAKIGARLSQSQSVPKSPANATIDNAPRKTVNDAPSGTVVHTNKLLINSNIFGAELFNNPSISFEPNQNMPTPKNYILSTGDQLIIDIYGYSEGTYKLSVTPDGYIRIPNVGPISVNGLTIEQAKIRIADNLANHGFSNIKTGKTSVNITLGNIRSIKVTLIGEVNAPGTYTMSSLSTVFSALYTSGGPGKNGSYRDIQLIRDNKVISTIDVYDFLMKGDKSGDLVLKDQDIIKINPYKTRISMNGEVKRALIFEAIETDNMQNLLDYAGGFTSQAYKKAISITRNTEREKEILDINKDEYPIFKPANGDSVVVGRILVDRFTNRVSIAGFVFRPGPYSLSEGMTVADLIEKADGLREEAYLLKATLFRKGDDLTPYIQSINLKKVLSGEENFLLQKDDKLVVYSKFEIKEAYSVSIRGEILKPGTYVYSGNMHINDIIYLAGGLKENAGTEVEISRRIKDVNVFEKNPSTTKVFSYNILTDNDTLVLEPFDEVFVKPLPGYKNQIHASIEGEVAHAGTYTLQSSNERISSLVIRAGGLTGSAFLPGATLARKESESRSNPYKEQQAITTLSKLKINNDTLQSDVKKGHNPDKTKLVTGQLDQESQITANADNTNGESDMNGDIAKNTNLVAINLDKALANPNSEWDLFLEEGDVLFIPKELQTVAVSGQVLFPSRITFKKGMSLKDYVSGAGGFAQNAQTKRAYVIYPNGNIKSTKSFLGFRSYPEIVAGSEIYIPEQAKKKSQLSSGERTALLISSLTAFTTVMVLLYGVMK